MFDNPIGGFSIGDMGWTHHQNILWPCIITQKSKLFLKDCHLPYSEFETKILDRIQKYCQDRFLYSVQILPLVESHSRFDFQLIPFNFVMELACTKNVAYNKALIQAIQIQSTFAIKDSKQKQTEKKHRESTLVAPPIKQPIHIGCPMVAGKYLFAKVVQHMVDPTLIKKITQGKAVVDLTSDLLKQGISHWKHTHSQVSFFGYKPIQDKKQTDFPTFKEYDYIRLGSQIIKTGELIELKNKQLFLLDKIQMSGSKFYFKGMWYNTKKNQVISIDQFKQRFDPCFDCDLIYEIVERCYWSGESIVDTDPKVTLDTVFDKIGV